MWFVIEDLGADFRANSSHHLDFDYPNSNRMNNSVYRRPNGRSDLRLLLQNRKKNERNEMCFRLIDCPPPPHFLPKLMRSRLWLANNGSHEPAVESNKFSFERDGFVRNSCSPTVHSCFSSSSHADNSFATIFGDVIFSSHSLWNSCYKREMKERNNRNFVSKQQNQTIQSHPFNLHFGKVLNLMKRLSYFGSNVRLLCSS